MSIEQITAAVDARVKELLPWIAEQQEPFRKSGKCVRLGWSHSQDPENGTPQKADRLSQKAVGGEKAWSDFGYPIKEPVVNASIDEYVMPGGALGWVLRLRLKNDGEVWVKAIDGGIGGFSRDWKKITTSIVQA